MSSSLQEVAQIAGEKSRVQGLPVLRQFAEMVFLFVFRRIGPGYYMFARMWRRSMSWDDKLAHWNGRRYLAHIHRLNDSAYFKISQNKLCEKSLLAMLALPCAPLKGFFQQSAGRDTAGHPLQTSAHLRTLLSRRQGRYFLKPAEGDSGRGALAIAVTGRDAQLSITRLPGGDPITVDELASQLARERAGYVIEAFIEQHPVISAMNPTSVNTLRIWVLETDAGAEVVGAFLRVGRLGSIVDNTAQGGLSCRIDLSTGRITQALDQSLRRQELRAHPDSGAPIVGVVIPHWAECMETAREALRVLPGARFAGMDIAVSTSGPMVVEYNVEPSYQGAAQFDVPHGRIFSGQRQASGG
jgi:hypothetical protein